MAEFVTFLEEMSPDSTSLIHSLLFSSQTFFIVLSTLSQNKISGCHAISRQPEIINADQV